MRRLARRFCICVFWLGFLAARTAHAETAEWNSSIFVLVDLSRSYYDQKTKPRISKVLGRVNQAVVELTEQLEQPTAFFMLPITASGLNSQPLCQTVFSPRLISKPTPGEL